ncbi:MAG TPA: NTP transferase domain-containing protein [Gemmatimonadales bacterium]|nr:NTP transferase domain-containing protein [Gemmatimonadales bacterium]
MPLTLVVMAAGLATRFGGPKQLTPVGPAGEALLDYDVYDAVRAGCRRVVFVVRAELADAFHVHARDVLGDALETVFVEQRLDDLPGGRIPPTGRVKPWGTAHALLAARGAVTGPFAVCNADDWYGPGAYRLLAEHVRREARAAPPVHALVGYRLDATLSEHGGVARGVAVTDRDGLLARLEEVRDVRRDAGGLTGVGPDGTRRALAGDAVASMNLWGFAPGVLAVLADQLARFLDAAGGDLDAEFPLSTAVNDQVALGQARLRVLTAPDRWFGMTFAADLPAVRDAVAALVRAGVYPADLRAAFDRL